MDARHAWRNFGNLTVDEAYDKFCESPEYYQEDFMFMGPVPFSFYFRVLDRYLRSVPDGNNFDDGEAWIIGQAFVSQLDPSTAGEIIHLADRITALADYVLRNIQRFGDKDDQKRVLSAWRKVLDTLKLRTAS